MQQFSDLKLLIVKKGMGSRIGVRTDAGHLCQDGVGHIFQVIMAIRTFLKSFRQLIKSFSVHIPYISAGFSLETSHTAL